MSTNKETKRFERKEKYMDSVGDEKLLAKINTIKKGTHIRPHFELHTQSSLLKKKEPKQCSSLKRLQKSDGSCVYKRRSGDAKQSKSLQALKTILMREKNCHEVFASLPNKLIKMAHSSKDCLENSFVLQNDSVASVFRNSVKSTECLTRSEIEIDSQNEITQSGENLKKSHAFQDDQPNKYTCNTQCGTANSLTFASLQGVAQTKNAFTSIKSYPFVETRRGTRLRLSDDQSENSHYKTKIYHALRSRESPEDGFLNEEYSIEALVCQHNVAPNVTCRNCTRKIWTTKRATIQSGDLADVDYSCGFELQGIKSAKRINDTRPVTSDVKMSSQRKYAGRDFTSNLLVQKPTGANKMFTLESTTSLTQKSSRLAVKSNVSRSNQQRNKHSSVEYTESLNSDFTKVLKSKSSSKLPMKENRDPCADHINCTLKLCKHLVEMEQTKDAKQQGMSNGKPLLKKRRSMTKVACFQLNNPTLGKRNDLKSRGLKSRSRSKSRSRCWQSRSATPKNSSKSRQNIDDNRIESASTCKKKSRPSEIIHTLKEIINSSKNNKDMEKNVQVSKSKEASKLICTVGTQTLPRCKKDVETECNMMPYEVFCKDAEVFCDLIDSTSSRTDVDSSAIRDDLVSKDISIHTIVGPRLVEYVKTDDESECSNVTGELSISKHDKIGDNTEHNTELESRISAGTTAMSVETIDTNHVFATKTKTIMDKDEVHKDDISLKSSRNHSDSIRIVTDKHEEFTKRLNDYDAICCSANNNLLPKKSRWIPTLSLYDYDASCSNSSEEATEHFEDVQNEDAPKLGVNNIPSDILVAFQIATQYAHNLHKAVLLYNESLMSQESEKQSRSTNEDRGKSMLGKNRCCVRRSASLLSCKSDDRPRSERDIKYQLIMTSDEDFDRFSACSSSSRGSLYSQLGLQNFGIHQTSCPEINLEEENAVLPQSVETSMKLVQKRSDLILADVRSHVRLLVHRTRKEHELEVLKLEELTDNGKLQNGKANGTVVFSAIKFVSVISREHSVLLIYCFLCTLAFWYLQFSFTCDSTQ